jgi:kumamolisin
MPRTYAMIPGSRRRLMAGSKLMGHCNPNERVELTLKLRRKTPLPPINGRPAVPISREDAAAKYGAVESEMTKVKDVMKKSGLEIVEEDQAARLVKVAGPIKAIEEVFQVKLFEYEHLRGRYRGRSGVVHIPSELDGIITGVYGLDNRRVLHRRRRLSPSTRTFSLAAGKSAARGFFPAQLAEIYDFPPGDGSGEVIGILEFGGGFFDSDLDLYCKTVGVPKPKVKTVSVDRSPTNTDDDAAGEVMLDIEVIAGACPGATQVVYFGSTRFDEKAWVDNLGKAIHDTVNNPFILSISWGNAEDSPDWQEGTVSHIDDTLHEAAMMGITVCVAAGDDGSADETDDGSQPGELDGLAHVDFPAASEFVLAVGGTDLRVAQGGSTETTWKDGNGRRLIPPSGTGTGGATGGGVSAIFPRPSFPSSIAINSVNPGAIAGRVIPDVAAHAESNGRTTGYFWVLDGQGGPNGGTSAAAPLWAALIARINAALQKQKGAGKRAGYITPVLYQNGASGQPVGSSACTDIVTGDNVSASVGGYSASAGYDAVTGWGSPIGSKLLDALLSIV